LLSHRAALFCCERAFTCSTIITKEQRQPEAAHGVGEETNDFAQVHFITVGFSDTTVASGNAMIQTYT